MTTGQYMNHHDYSGRTSCVIVNLVATTTMMIMMMMMMMMTTPTISSSVACPTPCACRVLQGEGTHVDCRRRGLTSVVADIPVDAVELDLGENPITNLNRSNFQSPSKLRRLRLDGCLVERLERTTFRNLQLLELLDLSRNRIQSVDDGSFQGLQHLRDLHLNFNDFGSSLPGYLFRGLTLNELQLVGNEISEIRDDLFGAAKISSLRLDDNHVSRLERKLFRPLESSLRRLSVDNNTIPLTVDDDTFAGTDLTSLSLASSNLLTIGFLPRTAATKIDLSGNALRLIVLPSTEDSGRLRGSCRELRLSNVQMDALDESLMSALRSLTELDLSGNRLVTVKPELFRFTPELTVLDLSRNRFVRFPDSFGFRLEKMEALNVSRSGLLSFNWDSLRTMTHLRSVDLSGNRLQVIPENVSGILESIEYFDISNNPWHCNCEMRWFRLWIISDPERTDVDYVCSSPGPTGPMLHRTPMDFRCTVPSFTFIAKSRNVAEGENVLLSCAAQSDPAPAIVWRAPFGDVLSITPPDDRTRTKTIADWAIHRIKPYQAGWYSCNASNLLQSVVTYTYLHVITAPGEEADLTDLAYPLVPSVPDRREQTTTTTASSTAFRLTDSRDEITTAVTSRKPIYKTDDAVANYDVRPGTTTLRAEDTVDGLADFETRHSVGRTIGYTTFTAAASVPTSTDDRRRSLSPRDLAIVIGVVVGSLVVLVLTVFVVFVAYKRRYHRKYPVARHKNDKLAAAASPHDQSSSNESTKLQMSSLDDSRYNSTVTDHLNPDKSRSH